MLKNAKTAINMVVLRKKEHKILMYITLKNRLLRQRGFGAGKI